MKKITRLIMGMVAALAIGTSFSGCAFFGSYFSDNQTICVKSNISDISGKTVTLSADEWKSKSGNWRLADNTGIEIPLTVNGNYVSVSDKLKTQKTYKLYIIKIGDTEYTGDKAIWVDISTDYDSYSAIPSDYGYEDMINVYGNADYTITIRKDSTGELSALLTGTCQ